MIRVRFEEPRNGWLPIEIFVGDHQLCFSASYVGSDFLIDLVEALVTYLNGRKAEVQIFEEPSIHKLTFSSRNGQGIFRIRSYTDELEARKEAGRSKLMAEVEVPPIELVLAFWRGLREFEGRVDVKTFQEHWRGGFPSEAVKRLGERVKSQRS